MKVTLDKQERYVIFMFGRKEFDQALKILQLIRGMDNESINCLVALACRISEIIDEDTMVEQLNHSNFTVIDGGKKDE